MSEYHETIEQTAVAAVKKPLHLIDDGAWFCSAKNEREKLTVIPELLAIPNANDSMSIDLVTIEYGNQVTVWGTVNIGMFGEYWSPAGKSLRCGKTLKLKVVEK